MTMHDCSGTMKALDLYNKAMEIINNSTWQICPKCKRRGIKDLNCTHITCDWCLCKWCYMCGGELTKGHNNWNNLNDKRKKEGCCPQYLRKLYDPTGNDPATALKIFHLHRLVLEMKKIISELFHEEKKATFTKMVKRYMPAGIAEDMAAFRQLQDVIKRYFKKSDQAWIPVNSWDWMSANDNDGAPPLSVASGEVESVRREQVDVPLVRRAAELEREIEREQERARDMARRGRQ
eukprot:jgi/Bigna1/137621/aug1.40_g12329